ncbi:hypothetical protein K474DRAFT_1710112 [Panus rudis PR-1116 ss-1]|nr:hypothetical protein K474DRAFT_1710112 [Panus rudis PR-1116 ss-1]
MTTAASSSAAVLRTPMPRPREPGAPSFQGSQVDAFLEEFEDAAEAAGLDKKKWPERVLRYCSAKVKDVLCHYPQFKGDDWDVAKAKLVELYKSNDDKPRATLEQLRALPVTKKTSQMDGFTSLRQVDSYIRKYVAIAGNLKDRDIITENEYNLQFYKGLPSAVRGRVRSSGQLKSTSSKKADPMDDVAKIVRQLYDQDDIDAIPDDEEGYLAPSDSDHLEKPPGIIINKWYKLCQFRRIIGLKTCDDDSDSDSDDSDDSSSEDEKPKKKKRVQSQPQVTQQPNVQAPAAAPNPNRESVDLSDRVQDLAEQMKCLAIAVQAGRETHQTSAGSPQQEFCPEAKRLCEEGLAMYNSEGKLVRRNGEELPMVRPGMGCVAVFLRNEAAKLKGKGRDIPSHMMAGTSSSTMNVGIMYDGADLLTGNVYAVEAPTSYETYPATRTQKKEVRFDPRAKPDKSPSDNETGIKLCVSGKGKPPAITVQYPNDTSTKTRRDDQSVPQPVPQADDVKRQGKAANPKRSTQATPQASDTDVDMKDAKSKGPTYRLTSDVQEAVDFDMVQGRVLDTQVTMSFKELLAMSPELQRRLTSMTKTRREYTTKAAEVSTIHYADELEYRTPEPRRAFVTISADEEQDLDALLERYASAVTTTDSLSGGNRLFAMVTGRFMATVGGVKLACLIDTGSELNLVSSAAFDAMNLPLDGDGRRWTLRGISGEAVPLRGCARDLPLEFGGHRFDHHFFVAKPGDGIGKQDVILGQPWLQWYAARINYARNGPMSISVFPGGTQRGTEVSFKLVSLDNQRNVDTLRGPEHSGFYTEAQDDF